MRAVMVTLLAIAGCGRIGFSSIDADADANANADANADAVTVDPCVAGDDPQPFDDPSPCNGWGSTSATNGTTLQQTGGELVVHATTMGMGFGGCLSTNTADFSRGAMFEVLSATDPSATTAYTVATAYAAGAGLDMVFLKRGGELQAWLGPVTSSFEIGALPYDSTTQRYWRYRATGSDVIAEVSPDALTWTLLARMTVAVVPSQVYPDLGAGTDSTEASPGTARFGGFNVCP